MDVKEDFYIYTGTTDGCNSSGRPNKVLKINKNENNYKLLRFNIF